MTQETTGEPSIMLCLSEDDRKLGSSFALSPEDLGAYACITLVMDGALACRILRENSTYREIWVAAGNEEKAMRLATSIKAEAPWRTVYLVQSDPTPSVRNRAREAGLDGVLSLSELVWRCETHDVRYERDIPLAQQAAVQPVATPVNFDSAQSAQQSFVPASGPTLPIAPAPMAPVVPPATAEETLAKPCEAASPASSMAPMSAPSIPTRAAVDSIATGVPYTGGALVAIGGSSAPIAPAPFSPPVDVPLPSSLPSMPLPSAPQPQTTVGAQGHISGSAGALISVVSGSGGSGKSTVAALLARQANRRGLRTALVDGDLQFGDLGTIAAASFSVPLDEVVAQGVPPSGFPQGEPVLFAAPMRLEAAELVLPQFESILKQLQARFDVVVVNTGGNWGDAHALLLEKSMSTIMLIDQRSSSVRACRHALDLCLRCGIATNAFTLVLNRCSKQARFSGVDVAEVLDGAHVAELSDGGSEVEEMMGSGLAEALVHGGNPLATSIDRLLSELLPGLLAATQVTGTSMAGASATLPATSAMPSSRSNRRRGTSGAPKKQRRSRKRTAAER